MSDEREMTLDELCAQLSPHHAANRELRAMRDAAKDLDELLLRCAFDGGGIGDEVVNGLGIDPWGTLRDFRSAFGLRPTMSAEEYAIDATKGDGEGS